MSGRNAMARAAVGWAEEHLEKAERNAVLPDVFATWFEQDREGVLEWFRAGFGPDDLDHRLAVRSQSHSLGELLVKWLGLGDPVQAAEFTLHDLYHFRTNVAFTEPGKDLVSSVRSGEDCRRVCQALVPFYERHGRHMNEARRVLERWQEIDPAAARRFLEEYPEREDDIFLEATERMKTTQAPGAAETADSLLVTADLEERPWTIRNIVTSWTSEGLGEARAWLEALGESEETYQGRAALAERLVADGPESAFSLIAPLPEGDFRESVLERMMETWVAQDRGVALDFLEAKEGHWPQEKVDRLRQLSVTAAR